MEKKELTEEQLMALTAAIDDFTEFRLALTKESDRGCALFAAAYLDNALAALLKANLVQNSKADDELFGTQSPLGTFSSRIKMAYYLGKIAIVERKDLDTIRQIRNDFAHKSGPIYFVDQSIADRCANLKNSWRMEDATPRQKFIAAVSGLMIHISHETRNAVALQEALDTSVPQEVIDAGRSFHAVLMDSLASKGSK